MSTITAGESLKFNLVVGIDSFEVHGHTAPSDMYSELFSEMWGEDFVIFVRPEPRMPNLFLMDMDKMFNLGNELPPEPVLPDDPNYPNVLKEEPGK